MIKKCEYCNKEFKTPTKHPHQRFCCKSCSVQARSKEDIGLFNNNIDDKIIKYIIGLILSDGCITTNGKKKVIVISLKDQYMIQYIRDLVCPTKKVYKDGINYQVRWRNQTDVETLCQLGITERKSLTAVFPKFDNENNIWHFIRGIFDGDGSVYNDHHYDKKYNKDYYYTRISISTASPQFANELNSFLHKYNINSRINKDSRNRDMYYIQISKQNDVKLFAQLIYQDSNQWKLIRKYNIFYNLQ
jgi:intein/homing endonuclease